MSKRKAIPADTEDEILLESARRCALCYGFDGDLSRKKGQVAHIDQDSSNADEANLVYLCLEHHDEYDSRTRQTKGVTKRELREYKRRLVEAVANGDHVKFEAAKNAEEKRTTGDSHQFAIAEMGDCPSFPMMPSTGQKPGKGTYRCRKCGTTVTLDDDSDTLPPCPKCSGTEFD